MSVRCCRGDARAGLAGRAHGRSSRLRLHPRRSMSLSGVARAPGRTLRRARKGCSACPRARCPNPDGRDPGCSGYGLNRPVACFMLASLPQFPAFCPLLTRRGRTRRLPRWRRDARILRLTPAGCKRWKRRSRSVRARGSPATLPVRRASGAAVEVIAPARPVVRRSQAFLSTASVADGLASRASTCASRARSWPRRGVRSALDG